MHEYARIYTNMHEYARICTNMHEYARICTNMHEYARIVRNTTYHFTYGSHFEFIMAEDDDTSSEENVFDVSDVFNQWNLIQRLVTGKCTRNNLAAELINILLGTHVVIPLKLYKVISLQLFKVISLQLFKDISLQLFKVISCNYSK